METIKDFLLNHAKEQPVSFHMPGHKGSKLYRDNGYGHLLDNIMDLDVTEIPGADNLFQTEGIIRATMDRYKSLYDAKESYLLINGSSAGIIASMMTIAKAGEKLIMARNCHKSAFNALNLGNIKPVYAYPEIIEEYGISGEITVEEITRCMDENPDAKGVILPSPNYYGICSDIEKIAREVHARGKLLMVDQAHGAHLKMFNKLCNRKENVTRELPKSAEEQGADLVINSIHKTLGAFTQSALLNLCTDKIDKTILEDKLQAIQSTSPSYILMTGLDVNADLLEKQGSKLLDKWLENLQYFYEEASKIKGLKVLMPANMDYTKMNLDMGQLGIDGLTLEEMLMKKGVFSELVTGNILMCMSGIGNSREDYDRLLAGLKEISEEHELKDGSPKEGIDASIIGKVLEMREIPTEKMWVDMDKAEGRVCASSIIPYPPGIPMICPGEVIDKEVIHYIKSLRTKGEKVMGVDDKMRVCVGK